MSQTQYFHPNFQNTKQNITMIVFKNIKILKPNQALIQTVLPLSLVG